MFEVVEFITDIFGEDEVIRGKFDTHAQAMAFIEAHYDENAENVFISDSFGEVVWG